MRHTNKNARICQTKYVSTCHLKGFWCQRLLLFFNKELHIFKKKKKEEDHAWTLWGHCLDSELVLSLVFSLPVLAVCPICKLRTELWHLTGHPGPWIMYSGRPVLSVACGSWDQWGLSQLTWCNCPKLSWRDVLLTYLSNVVRETFVMCSVGRLRKEGDACSWCSGSCLTLKALRKPLE